MEFTDFKNHHIEGFAHMGNTPFSMPLLSEIEPGFWQGGCPVGLAPKEFDFIINLYHPWGKYHTHDHQIVLNARLWDHADIPDERLLLMLARYVNQCRRLGMTLVHCQAGLNRSALVAGLALVESGMSGEQAIKLLRDKRCEAVLCNSAFENWLAGRNKAELREAA